ncbi:MAG TPA: hypothetical protein VGK19_20960 [Capsulimonadaceae bacterium]
MMLRTGAWSPTTQRVGVAVGAEDESGVGVARLARTGYGKLLPICENLILDRLRAKYGVAKRPTGATLAQLPRPTHYRVVFISGLEKSVKGHRQ